MKYNLIILLLFMITNSYSFTQSITPTNNSIISNLNQSIDVIVYGSENVSSFIDWDNSLVGYWNFDSGNSTHVYDLSENNNDGEYINGVVNNNSEGVRGNYSQYNTSNYIEYKNNIEFNNNDFTISAWFYLKGNSVGIEDDNIIFSQRVSSTGDGNPAVNLFVRDGQDRVRAQIRDNIGSLIDLKGSTPIFWSRWYHGVLVKNLSEVKLYLNSNFEASKNHYLTGDFDQGAIHRYMGLNKYSGNDKSFFNGNIDEVMVFNRTLSQDEINALYNSQVNNFQFNATNLNNLTTYNYTIYSINTTGDLLKQSINFFTNTSYLIPTTLTVSNSILPAQGMLSMLLLTFILGFYFMFSS